jgi:hypothetical protein
MNRIVGLALLLLLASSPETISRAETQESFLGARTQHERAGVRTSPRFGRLFEAVSSRRRGEVSDDVHPDAEFQGLIARDRGDGGGVFAAVDPSAADWQEASPYAPSANRRGADSFGLPAATGRNARRSMNIRDEVTPPASGSWPGVPRQSFEISLRTDIGGFPPATRAAAAKSVAAVAAVAAAAARCGCPSFWHSNQCVCKLFKISFLSASRSADKVS